MSKRAETAPPYPAPRSERCRQMMLGVIAGFGKLPANDDEIEDRVLACVLVAWGELAAMRDERRRDQIVGELDDLGKRVVGKLVAVSGELGGRAQQRGQSLVEMLYDAVDEGTADEFPMRKRRSQH
jgi:hypothetical protein